jgi:competence protein ComEA
MPFNVSRSTALVVVCALVAMLAIAGNRIASTGTTAAPDVVAPLEPATAAAPERLVVHVVGAVRRPGLYRLREGMRVADAVNRAGGTTRRADLNGLNLAAPLVDGTQVLVPSRIPTTPAASGGSLAPTGGEVGSGGLGGVVKVSLASATAEQLDGLPGVGPVTAQKILDYRAEHGPFRSVDELDDVPGIGPTRVEQLRDLVTP